MDTRTHRSFKPCRIFFMSVAAMLFAAPALAFDFTVHGYDLGERIELTSGRRVWTAEFDVSLETVADHVASFCVDLDTHISVAQYAVRGVLDAYSDLPPPDEAPRDFRWAGHVMDRYGHDVDLLVTSVITRDQAITGVQAAIWEGTYGGGIVDRGSLSGGARSIYDQIMGGRFPIPDGPALVVDLVGAQDQVISNAVPEPSAALIFGVGSVLVGSLVQRRER
jgi:hypothetical protein